MLERHLDTEDELKIKKRMAQFMANAVTQVNMHCKQMTDKTKLFGSEALELLLLIIFTTIMVIYFLRYYKVLLLQCELVQLKMITSYVDTIQLDLTTGNLEFN